MTAHRIKEIAAAGKQLLPPRGPHRLLAGGVLARAVGLGGILPTVAVFFVHSGGLSGKEVGLGMSVASVFGLIAAVPAGRLVDRIGARRVLICLPLAAAGVFCSYALVHSLPAFLLAGSATAVCLSSTRVAEATLIQQVLDPKSLVRSRARLSAVHNLGFAVGVLAMAIPLQAGTRSAYLWFIAASALVTACSALFAWLLPGVPRPRTPRPALRLGALRDLPYLSLSVLTGLTTVHNQLLTIAAPLWVIGHTEAPRTTASLLLTANSVLVVCLQVSAARGTDTTRGAVGVNTRGGIGLMLGCLLFGAGAGLPPGLAAATLVLATAVLTCGEMWTAAAAWNFGYALADPRAVGDYQGVYGLGRSLSDLVGPAMATAVVALGTTGWALAGLHFLLLSVLTRLAVGLAQRRTTPPREDACPSATAA
ncbi:MFS transporter [Streptomyces bicolor]|uniref:MFS transporter n=1 Tax=Streptomyces bicolor TaxID=66874 RepID=UPI00068C54ED|nr:MFS transporter [Streptomyces bicolor]